MHPGKFSSRQRQVFKLLTRSNRHFCGRALALRWGHFGGTLHLTYPAKTGITDMSVWDEFGGVYPLAEVRIQEGESLENALRRFKRKVQQEDIIKEVKRHSFYLKRS